MNLTAILCTFNRCQLLAKALENVAASILPQSVEWEVLVVDNNSRDQTREVVQDFCRRYPGRFRYLFEPQPGKSYALNSGVRETRGEILAFLDDDPSVETKWLRNLTCALESPEWARVGGRIILRWPASLPNWLSVGEPYGVRATRAILPATPSPALTRAVDGGGMGENWESHSIRSQIARCKETKDAVIEEPKRGCHV